MLYLPAIAMYLETPKPSAVADISLKIVFALIPLLLSGAFKWLDERGLDKRRANLIERIAKTAKNYSELPELPEAAGDATERLRRAFQVELESAYRELTLLQTQVNKRPIGVASVTSALKSAFLWYRPRGFAAWLLHISFYASLLLIGFMALGYFASGLDVQTQETVKTSTGAVAAVIFTFFSIPPLILRHFAARIHRRQCAPVQEAEIAAAGEPVPVQ